MTIEQMEENTTSRAVHSTTLLGIFICALGAIFYSYEYFLRISPSVMTTQLMENYNINAPALGALSGYYYLAYVPMQLPVGMLMDLMGPRRLLTVACAICVVGTYLFVGTPYLWLASIGRLMVGFGSAFAYVGVLKLASIWLPPRRFAMFAGLAAALGTVGAMFGVVLLTQLVASIGWKATTHATAVAGIVLTVVLWLIIRDYTCQKEADENGNGTITKSDIRKSFQELKMILTNPQMWVVGFIGCFIYLPTTVFAEMWGITYLQHAKHFSPTEASFGVSALFLGFTLGAPFFGWLSDVLQTRRRLLLYASLLATLLAAALLYLHNLSTFEIYAILFLLGVSYSAQALVFAVGREVSPNDAGGTAIAVTNMIVMLGGLCLQPLVGYLLDWSWSGMPKVASNLHVYTSTDYQFALSIIPAGILISSILTLFLKETYGQVNE